MTTSLQVSKTEELEARIAIISNRLDTQARELSRAIAEVNWALNQTIDYLQQLADSEVRRQTDDIS